MDDPFIVYVLFNRIEGTTWIIIALALPFFVRRRSKREGIGVGLASLGFVLFGISDFLEAPLQGQLPWWLWLYKILCAAFLLSCRFIYIGWDRFGLGDRYFRFGLICLTASLGAIGLQHWLYG